MVPPKALPLPPGLKDEEFYVKSLLAFVTSHDLFQRLCGGVHILDFLTQEPDLYATLLPQDWRTWFEYHDTADILDLLMREDLSCFDSRSEIPPMCERHIDAAPCKKNESEWREGPTPPSSLLQYIKNVRRHTLNREFRPVDEKLQPNRGLVQLSRQVTVGMKPKKIHEVQHFVKYIDELTSYINDCTEHKLSHIADFGSGQNYLGRALASPPFCQDIIAIESKPHNISGAKFMDISAKLAEKERVMRNKKEYRITQGKAPNNALSSSVLVPTIPTIAVQNPLKPAMPESLSSKIKERTGSIQYLEAVVCDGDLSNIVPQIKTRGATTPWTVAPKLLVISLHSCGNLLHHGLRSLVFNPSVRAVAMVGCCYNLMTERLGPPTYKVPSLRHSNERLHNTSTACDPHGFPMSEHLASYKHQDGEGVRLNITARMMAVQAPRNWTSKESEDFFSRHFFRALLQRIFVDKGVLGKPGPDSDSDTARSPRGWSGPDQAIILGSLRKSCYTSFVAYVRGALAKLRDDPIHGNSIARLAAELTDENITEYEDHYKARKKELSIVWSLMAFSAGVVESAIIVDRWLYLREQKEVKESWVEPVFEYECSPRNLVVVGIKG